MAVKCQLVFSKLSTFSGVISARTCFHDDQECNSSTSTEVLNVTTTSKIDCLFFCENKKGRWDVLSNINKFSL